MKWIFLLFFLGAFHIVANTVCRKAFERPVHPQFTETLLRYFFFEGKWSQERAFESDLKSFVTTDKTREEILRYLIHKKHIKVKVKNYFTPPNPLFHSIINRTTEDTITLMKENPNMLYDGTLLSFPPFFLMVHIGNQKLVLATLKIDPSLVHSENIMKETPLHLAIDKEIAEILLHYKANPNAQDKRGRTPLHNSRNLETVKFLLKHNADIKIRDRSGLSVIKYHLQFSQDSQIINALNTFRENQRLNNIMNAKTKNLAPLSETEKSSKKQETRKDIAERNKEERKAKKKQKNEERKEQAKKRYKAMGYERNMSALEIKKLQKKNRKEQRQREQQKTKLLQELKTLRESEKRAMNRLKILNSQFIIKLFSLVLNQEQYRKSMKNKQSDILKKTQKAISRINNQLKHLSDTETNQVLL